MCNEKCEPAKKMPEMGEQLGLLDFDPDSPSIVSISLTKEPGEKRYEFEMSIENVPVCCEGEVFGVIEQALEEVKAKRCQSYSKLKAAAMVATLVALLSGCATDPNAKLSRPDLMGGIGSYPSGMQTDVHKEWMQMQAERNARLIMDSSQYGK